MMKTLYRIGLCINFLLLAFLLVRASEMFTKNWVDMNTRTEAATPEQKHQIESETMDLIPPDTVKQASNNEETTSCDTACRIIACNLTEGTNEESICEIPSSYIGKTRQQLLEVMDVYNQSPPLSEQNKGFVSMELVTFSREEITIQKMYEQSLYYGCILVEDEYLTVYDENRKQVLLYTDITLDSLPEDVKQQVIDGKYIKTERQLYDFLESYSS